MICWITSPLNATGWDAAFYRIAYGVAAWRFTAWLVGGLVGVVT